MTQNAKELAEAKVSAMVGMTIHSCHCLPISNPGIHCTQMQGIPAANLRDIFHF